MEKNEMRLFSGWRKYNQNFKLRGLENHKKYHVLFDWLLITVIDLTPFHLINFQMDAASFRPNQNPFHELRFGGSDGKQRG